MLVELKKLQIINEGHKRQILTKNIYINSTSVVSVVDYEGVKNFLVRESIDKFQNNNFSLVRINIGNKVEEIIVFGTAQEVFSSFTNSRKKLLNG